MSTILATIWVTVAESAFAQSIPVDSSVGQPEVRRTARPRTLQGFVANHGQWPVDVRYIAMAGGVEVTLFDDALSFRTLVSRSEEWERGAETVWSNPLVFRLPKGSESRLRGEDPLPTRHHFLLGSDRSRWASDVRGFQRVVYEGVATGIDLELQVEGDPKTGRERFVYDVEIAPGADLSGFVLHVEGLSGPPKLDGAILSLPTETAIAEHRLGASWEVDVATGSRQAVDAAYRVTNASTGGATIGYEVVARDSSRALTIDPSLDWATYVGGVTQEYPKGIEVDATGAVYLACTTPFGTPTTPGGFLPVATPSTNAWIGKLSSDGGSLLWATFLGGEWSEGVTDFEVDSDGTVVVLGGTQSGTFPVTEGSYQPNYLGTPQVKGEIYITRLAAR